MEKLKWNGCRGKMDRNGGMRKRKMKNGKGKKNKKRSQRRKKRPHVQKIGKWSKRRTVHRKKEVKQTTKIRRQEKMSI